MWSLSDTIHAVYISEWNRNTLNNCTRGKTKAYLIDQNIFKSCYQCVHSPKKIKTFYSETF